MHICGMLKPIALGALLTLVVHGPNDAARAQDADMAKQLANPIANLISVPFQFNYDHDTGAADAGER